MNPPAALPVVALVVGLILGLLCAIALSVATHAVRQRERDAALFFTVVGAVAGALGLPLLAMAIAVVRAAA